LHFFIAPAHMPWHRSGRWGEGPRTETALARLELKPAAGSSNEKEANHGNEEEKKEDGEAGSSRKVTTQARASYGCRAAVFRDGGRT
jgi:hypothetical protein